MTFPWIKKLNGLEASIDDNHTRPTPFGLIEIVDTTSFAFVMYSQSSFIHQFSKSSRLFCIPKLLNAFFRVSLTNLLVIDRDTISGHPSKSMIVWKRSLVSQKSSKVYILKVLNEETKFILF